MIYTCNEPWSSGLHIAMFFYYKQVQSGGELLSRVKVLDSGRLPCTHKGLENAQKWEFGQVRDRWESQWMVKGFASKVRSLPHWWYIQWSPCNVTFSPLIRLPKSGSRSHILVEIFPWWETTPLVWPLYSLAEGLLTHKRKTTILTNKEVKSLKRWNSKWKITTAHNKVIQSRFSQSLLWRCVAEKCKWLPVISRHGWCSPRCQQLWVGVSADCQQQQQQQCQQRGC